MAFTQSDIDALDRAIASGELEVEINGRRVRYRDIDQLLKAKAAMAAEVASTSRRVPRFQSAVFSDG